MSDQSLEFALHCVGLPLPLVLNVTSRVVSHQSQVVRSVPSERKV